MNSSWLVCTDFSTSSDRVVDEAAKEADKLRVGLHLMHVYNVPRMSTPLTLGKRDGKETIQEFAETLGVNSMKLLEDAKNKLRAQYPKLTVSPVVREGDAVEEIIALASELKVERVVVGTHSRKGFGRLLMGSVAERVVRLCPVSVLVVKLDEKRD